MARGLLLAPPMTRKALEQAAEMAVMFAIEGLYSNFEQRATNDSHSKEAAETRQAFILAVQQERETLRSWRWLLSTARED